jgi:hypothetical protein
VAVPAGLRRVSKINSLAESGDQFRPTELQLNCKKILRGHPHLLKCCLGAGFSRRARRRALRAARLSTSLRSGFELFAYVL